MSRTVLALACAAAACGCSQSYPEVRDTEWFREQSDWVRSQDHDSPIQLGYNEAVWVGVVSGRPSPDPEYPEAVWITLILDSPEALVSARKTKQRDSLYVGVDLEDLEAAVPQVGETWAVSARSNAKGHWSMRSWMRVE